jgi:unsaturated rhamnogalacturonyl hydrolase
MKSSNVFVPVSSGTGVLLRRALQVEKDHLTMSSTQIRQGHIHPKFSLKWMRPLLAAAFVLQPLGCDSGTTDDNDTAGTGAADGVVGVGGAGVGGEQPFGSGGAALPSGGVGPVSGGAPAAGGGGTEAGGSPGLGGTGGGSGGSDIATGGATPGAGGTADGACVATCVDQCTEWGGTEQAGTCDGAQICCDGATPPMDNPLSHLATSAEDVGLLLANRFNQQQLSFSNVANLPGDGYKSACEWYGSLGVAKLTSSQSLLDSLVTKFDPFKTNFASDMMGGEAHVDRYIFGMVPLEIYLQTDDASYLSLGTDTADDQQVTNQVRNAIDDMFMMTGLQLQAYRATGDAKYIDFMASTMVDYLDAQQANGLFFHNITEARTHWGRGNGWFAAGMAEIMRDLPEGHANYAAILDGYMKMMEGLVAVQGPNGLWYQVLDMPNDSNNWEESSGSAMFTYAMVAGVRRGVLDAATYVPVIEAAWAGLQSKISAQGDVSGICVGTWYKASPQEYMALTRLTGDGHGQAPVLWVAAELLR